MLRLGAAGGIGLAVLALGGCAVDRAEDRVAQLRSHYRAALVGFMVLPSPATVAGGAPARPGTGGELVDSPIATSDIELRIQIQHDSPVKLAGLTLEVQLLGPNGDDNERQHDRVWVDVSAIEPGPGGEVRANLREVSYAAGERFHVFVRPNIPANERALYREFLSSR